MTKTLWRPTFGTPSGPGETEADPPFDDAVDSRLAELPPALTQDIARCFRQLGVATLRASLVNLDAMRFQAAWTIAGSGEVTGHPLDQPVDSAFPAAHTAIGLLSQTADDETLLHQLTPRRWGLAWRLDEPNVVLAEVQFHDRRDAIDASDQLLLRLTCSVAMGPGGPAALAGLLGGGAAPAWPGTERPAAQPPRLLARLSVVLVACSALLGLSVAALGVPELRRAAVQREAQRTQLQALADKTLVRGLGTALGGGDYGDVQTALSSYASLGYFQGAAVLNPGQRVVALSGRTDPLRIGDPVPDEIRRGAQAIDLVLGTERLGQLLVLPSAAPAPVAGAPGWLQPAAWGAGLAALAALVAAVLAMRRPGPPLPR